MQLSLSRSDGVAVSWLRDEDVATLAEIAAGLGPDGAGVDLIVLDDPGIALVNERFRGKNKATDVISFSYLEGGELVDPDDLAGEIYISHQTLEREANELGVSVNDLFLRIGVHGLMHIMGHDHENDEDADRMESEERRLLESHLAPDALKALF